MEGPTAEPSRPREPRAAMMQSVAELGLFSVNLVLTLLILTSPFSASSFLFDALDWGRLHADPVKTFCFTVGPADLWPQRVKIHSHNFTE